MSHTTDARAKLQELLRDLFQFDCADLDFGIYRIMNHKRAEIERFIEKDLLDAIGRELDQGALSSQAQAAAELAEVEQQVRETLAEDALSPERELSAQYRTTKLGQRYLELREEAATYHARPEQETLVFNHLVAFFSRYYQDGDFISKRRYSKRERYAIPYNGEEVYLHWANKDQYYVKSGEHFTDYTFKAPGDITVHFQLQAADVEQDNAKGEKRFFLPLAAKVTWDEAARELTIPFEYRPLNEQESITYGARDQQEKIIGEARAAIPVRLRKYPDVAAALAAERHRNGQGEPVSYLAHHLRQYTRRNTSDFFIHKDLRGFLERELSFYLKNEVLNLEEVLAGDDGRAEGWFQLMQVIRRIALRVIAFLAQIEEFQKALWEKKKFVLSTEYCMTLDRVPEDFYPEIAANQWQIEEWRRLFRIDEISPTLFHSGGKAKKAKGKGRKAGLDVAFLKAHPTLVLDTRFFAQEFKDRLLASFADLEEQVGGLLIHGENFQALSLLLDVCRQRVECVYIDPPFNSPGNEILYKNDYKDSSWLSLVEDRLAVAAGTLSSQGSLVVAIDENEQERLGLLLDDLYPDHDRTNVVVVHNPRGIQGNAFSYCNEFAVFLTPHGQSLPKRQLSEEKQKPLMKTGSVSMRSTGKTMFYPLYVKGGRVVRIGDVPPEDFHPRAGQRTTPGGEVEVWPVDSEGNERKWRYKRESLQGVLNSVEVRPGRDGRLAVYLGKTTEAYKTVWSGPEYNAAEYGSSLVKHLGLESGFSFPKSLHTVADCLRIGMRSNAGMALDYFAGSGTTAHAVLDLNAEDGGARKYTLVEMAGYFDTVLKPRIEKIMFSREWKDGKPTSNQGHSHMFKYQRLESYEDALNNIAFSVPVGQAAMEFDDYLLRYMLDFETRDSETLLNAAKLASPFSYTLRIHRDGETQEHPVDLPETFNYLIGLHVKTRKAYDDRGRRYLVYRGSNQRADVVVIWRDTKGWTQADLERDKQFVLKHKLAEGADEVFVNGDSFIPGAKALDPVFKRLMLGGTD